MREDSFSKIIAFF